MSYQLRPAQTLETMPEQACVLDVRTAAEVAAEQLPGSLHIPLHELTADKLRAELARHGGAVDTLYLLCQSGQRARAAANVLDGKLDQNLCVIDGGVNALRQCRVALERGPGKTISLERQVRIAAGSLVLVGVLLGALVAPGFYVLSGFVGAGLVFAGVSNTCAMGMLLARLPWNRG